MLGCPGKVVKNSRVGRQKTIKAGEAEALQCVHLQPKGRAPTACSCWSFAGCGKLLTSSDTQRNPLGALMESTLKKAPSNITVNLTTVSGALFERTASRGCRLPQR